MKLSVLIDSIQSDISFSHISNRNVDIQNRVSLIGEEETFDTHAVYLVAKRWPTEWLKANWDGQSVLNLIICGGDFLTEEFALPNHLNLLCTNTDIIAFYNRLNKLFHSYDKCVSEIKNAIIENSNLQAIADIAAENLEAAVYILDMAYKTVGANTRFIDYICEDSVGILKEITPCLLYGDTLPVEALNCLTPYSNINSKSNIFFRQLISKGISVGFLLIIFSDQNVSALRRLLAEGIYTRLNQYASLYPAFQNRSAKLDLLIRDIIERRLQGVTEISKQANALNITIPPIFVCLIIELRLADSISTQRFRKQLEDIFPAAIAAMYKDQLILIFPAKKYGCTAGDRAQLVKHLNEHDAYVGISFPASLTTALPVLYQNAAFALRVGKQFVDGSATRTFLYEEYWAYHLVEFCCSSAHDNYHFGNPGYLCHPAMIRLSYYDRKGNDNLTEILWIYLTQNCNVQSSAKVLYMHRNTMLAKIKKIESIIGRSLSDVDVQDALKFSYRVMQYAKKVLHYDIIKSFRPFSET